MSIKKRVVVILAGLFAVMSGLGFILPVLAKVRAYGGMPAGDVLFYTAGVVLMLVGLGAVAYGLCRRKSVQLR